MLASLAVNKYKAATGRWAKYVGVNFENKEGEELQPHLEAVTECHVCALGACFTSAVKLGDNYKVTGSMSSTAGIRLQANDAGDPGHDAAIKAYFTPRQSSMIEIAFERGYGFYQIDKMNFSCDYDEFYKAKAFGEQYNMPHDRLEAIMKNIVENKGNFKP